MSQRDHVDPCDVLAGLPSGVRASQSGLHQGKLFLHAWFSSMASTDNQGDDQSHQPFDACWPGCMDAAWFVAIVVAG